MRRFLLALCAAATSGCPERETTAPAPDRTLEALRKEVDRANRGEAVGRPPASADDPNARLAELATGHGAPRELPLPPSNTTVHLGTVAMKLSGLRAMHSVRAGKVDLTSEDVFLEISLAAQNVGAQPVSLDLLGATVRDASGNAFPIARDAQRAAGTRELSRSFEPQLREDVRLFFEVSAALIGHGLTLQLPAPGGSTVAVPLDATAP